MLLQAPDITGDIYQGLCPYDFTEDGFEYDLFRPFFKGATLKAINCKTPKAAMGVINMSIRDLPEDQRKRVSGKRVLAMIQKKHAPIADKFGSGFGLGLQYADSQLASSILSQCMHDGIPALPVHDSFIVPVEHDGYIQELMGNAFRERYGCNIAVE
ncbi:MAG: hypothetical protein HRU04_18460 [Oceanospirillaceae bacterium]|nr:hypothetical protein [Oceanospirillaceae bacterium]